MSEGAARGLEENARARHQAIAEVCERVRAQEHHFNDIETQVRQLASGWLLAALGAVAYLVKDASWDFATSAAAPASSLHPLTLIAIVALMGVFGLCVLWVLDQLVYHRLLNAAFLLGLFVEFRNPWVAPERTLMMLVSRKRGMARYMKIYYFGPMAVLSATGLAAGAWYWVAGGPAGAWPLLPGLVASGSVAASWWWQARLEKYADLAHCFGDAEFVGFLRDERFEDVVRRSAVWLSSAPPPQQAPAASKEEAHG